MRVALKQSHSHSSRVKFMLDTIADLKNNRRKLVTDTSAAYEPLLKLIRSMCEKRSQTVADPLRIPYRDLLVAEEKGSRPCSRFSMDATFRGHTSICACASFLLCCVNLV